MRAITITTPVFSSVCGFLLCKMSAKLHLKISLVKIYLLEMFAKTVFFGQLSTPIDDFYKPQTTARKQISGDQKKKDKVNYTLTKHWTSTNSKRD